MAAPLRFVVASDNHGDLADHASTSALFDFIADYKPQIRVHAGDNWDFRNLRRGASDEERAGTLQDDWDAGADFLRRLFDGGRQNHFLRGNHDERLWHFAANCDGIKRDYAQEGIKRVESIVKRCNGTMLPYDSRRGVLDLGKLRIIHGYHAGVGAARQHAAVYGNCIFGHVHTQESAPVASLEPAEAKSIGCLCAEDIDYINGKTGKLRWAQGWAYGLLFDDGTYQLSLTRKINGRFHCATNFKSY